MEEAERLKDRIIQLEVVLADYMARFGITESARQIMIRPAAQREERSQP